MNITPNEHARVVDEWIKGKIEAARSPDTLILLFNEAAKTLWARALPALGDITLSAIAARTIRQAAERFPVLSTLEVESSGISFQALKKEIGEGNREGIEEALAFMLIEFLSVLGRLTGGILDRELHSALAGTAIEHAATPEERALSGEPLSSNEVFSMETTNWKCIQTGVRNLDEILGGGLPVGAVCAVAGAPGTGKTILAQQISFHVASEQRPAIVFNTLSEPAAKTLSHLSRFSFFDKERFGRDTRLVDLGTALRKEGLDAASKLILEHVRGLNPALIVIDSFKSFSDFAESQQNLRRFIYEIGVNLMAWECASLLVGEYGPSEYERNPLLSMVDGYILLSQLLSQGEEQRFIQVRKMRGAKHNMDEHAFNITGHGIDVFAPRVTIKRVPTTESIERHKTGISGLDELLAGGIMRGTAVLVGGAAGTGKTVLLLEFIYRGAQAGEKGILFSFEETKEQLCAAARSLGFDIDKEIEKGLIKIVFIPQPDIRVESHLVFVREEIEALGAQRVAIDSVAVFLRKITDPQISREKVFQLATLVQNAQAIALFSTDVPYGSTQLSCFGVEETVLDGVILLTALEEGLERERYIEAYKLRMTDHLRGRHALVIQRGGLKIFPRHAAEPIPTTPPPAMQFSRRRSSGVPGLDEKIGGGFLENSVTLLSGSAGVGKSTFAFQFLLNGVKNKEKGIFVTLGEGPEQLMNDAMGIGLPVREAVIQGMIDIVYLSPEEIRAGQFLFILSDRVKMLEATRLVFDSMSGVVAAGLKHVPLADLLYTFAFRFKTLGVTTLVTVEAQSTYSEEPITEMAFSPIADNILLIRYQKRGLKVEPALRILKTRGSTHDPGVYYCIISSKGGISIGPEVDQVELSPARSHRHRDHRLARR